MFEDINSHPDNTVMALEFNQDAKAAPFLLTNSHHDIIFLEGTKTDTDGSGTEHVTKTDDILATSSGKRLMAKLRDMQASGIINRDPTSNNPLEMSALLRLQQEEIEFRTVRLAPAGRQRWLLGTENIVVEKVLYTEINMRDGSAITERLWGLIQLVFTSFSDKIATLQASFSAKWERQYLKKALKVDERRRAQYIFSEVRTQLGSGETICSYHRLYDGNDHKNIHCKYFPCYLHALEGIRNI